MAAAEEVFGRYGYHDASIAEITRRASVAQGSFYIYFPSKLDIFRELIIQRGEELRECLRDAAASASGRLTQEEAAFHAFFEWIAEHPWVYRVVRQAEFIDAALREAWYREFADEYAIVLKAAMDRNEIAQADPEVVAWAVMGMADFTAMRFIVWEGGAPMSPATVQEFVALARRALIGSP